MMKKQIKIGLLVICSATLLTACNSDKDGLRDNVSATSKIYQKSGTALAKEKAYSTGAALSAPTLSSDQLNQSTKTGRIKLTVGNVPDGAELYYSVDGSEPSILSKKGSVIIVDPHFKSDKNPEPDKQMTIKLRYEYNGSHSSIGTYQINVHKDYKSYICI